jgi:mono/diheme cytochrome c family protein
MINHMINHLSSKGSRSLPPWRVLSLVVMMHAAVIAASGTAGPTPQRGDPKALKNPVPATAASVDQGRAVFQNFCSKCHGEEGKGDGRQAPEGSHPANLTDDHWDHGSTDGEIFTTIHDGVGPKYDMDSYEGKITDTNIWNLVNYIRSIGPKPAR